MSEEQKQPVQVEFVEPDPVEEELPPLPDDVEYVVRFSQDVNVSGHVIKAGNVAGSLSLKFGLSPLLFAERLGRGMTAEIE